MSTIDYALGMSGPVGGHPKSNILLLNDTGLTWSPPMKQRRGSWIWLDWLWGFATHQPVDYCVWNFTILLSYTPMMSAFYGLKRTFSGLTLEFSGWKQGGFLPHHTWSIYPIGWFLSWVSSRLAARWISLDLNADHYPTATGLQRGGMLMIDGWRLQNFMTAIDIVWRSGYKLSHDTGLPTLTNFRNGATGAFVGRLVSKKMSFNETFWWSNVINMMGNICQQLNHVWLSLSLSLYI
jgi:hypothetical protein